MGISLQWSCSMQTNPIPDMSCVPYRHKVWYFFLTLPFDLIMLMIGIYLWIFSPFLSLGMLVFFGMMCWFQAYCCVHQDCPYIGGFCPAVIGIMPASWIAKWRYRARPPVKSQRSFNQSVTFAMIGWVGLILLPLFWLAKLDLGYVCGYVALHAIYTLIFGMTVCPVCAIRNTCPGGKFHQMFQR